MEISVKRIQELIKEEYDKVGNAGPVLHAKGLGTFGTDPKSILQSAVADIEMILAQVLEAHKAVETMARDTDKLDAEELEIAIGKLGSSRLRDNAVAKLEGALERQIKVNEGKNEKK